MLVWYGYADTPRGEETDDVKAKRIFRLRFGKIKIGNCFTTPTVHHASMQATALAPSPMHGLLRSNLTEVSY